MLMVGDTVVHPGHGICRVVGNKIADDTVEYYVLKPDRAVEGNGLIMVEASQSDTMGLRCPVSPEDVPVIFNIMESPPEIIQLDNTGNMGLKDLLKRGELRSIAAMARDLSKNEWDIFPPEAEALLESAKRKIAGEISYVSKMPLSRVQKMVASKLKKSRK